MSKESNIKPIDRTTTMEEVLDRIRNSLLEDLYRPGMQLKQSEIASQLGVSQGLVREALARLVEEGLVTDIPYRGKFVTRLSAKDVNEIYQLRGALEPLAVHLGLARIMQNSHIHELRKLNERILVSRRHGQATRAAKADIEFHRYIVHMSENSRLIKAWESLIAQSKYLIANLYGLRVNPEGADHTEILEAIQTGQTDITREVIQNRFDKTVEAILSHLERQDEITESKNET